MARNNHLLTQRSVVEKHLPGKVGGQFGNESRIQLGAVRVIGLLLLQVGEDPRLLDLAGSGERQGKAAGNHEMSIGV